MNNFHPRIRCQKKKIARKSPLEAKFTFSLELWQGRWLYNQVLWFNGDASHLSPRYWTTFSTKEDAGELRSSEIDCNRVERSQNIYGQCFLLRLSELTKKRCMQSLFCQLTSARLKGAELQTAIRLHRICRVSVL